MRGADIQQDRLFSTVIPEERVPPDHPLRPIREMVNTALKELDSYFNALYSDLGRDDTNRSSAIDGRTTCHPGYATSQMIRKWIEECFGWAKTIGGLRKSRFIGREKLDFQFVLTFAAYNLIRMRNLKVVSC